MFLRLSRVAGLPPGRLDDMVEELAERADSSGLSESSGFRGYLVAADRNAGKITAISLWETWADLEASDRAADEARAQRLERAEPAREPIVDRYEVVLQRGLLAGERAPGDGG